MRFLFIFLATFSLIAPVRAQKDTDNHEHHIVKDTMKGSPAREIVQAIGQNQFTLKYYSPGVKGRVIWGGLVAFDKVWVTGAHRATSLEFTKDVVIAGKTIPAGKYAFFTIPSKKNWTLILNKNWNQHLADDYSEQEDVLRWTVKPEKLKTEVSRLMYKIEPASNTAGKISMAWEKIRVSFEVKNVER